MATLSKGLITLYCEAAMAYAEYEKMDTGRWFGEIPVCPGVWGDGATRTEAAEQLRSSLEGWILLKLQDGDHDLPTIDGLDLYPR
ncbi:MAG: type II toxin-antitoxin system HicB family antitoxin [Firmicutes bacterium]|jgi:predicted RNase H-like HicB family nuclease|nr:type II toxin-antitoxin system HicB family antitoxin [Bacillota bacterium]MCL5064545.1 type II toxin-antitoxin system HicB family antitoxin [Bacillota bacterium]